MRTTTVPPTRSMQHHQATKVPSLLCYISARALKSPSGSSVGNSPLRLPESQHGGVAHVEPNNGLWYAVLG